MGKAASAQELVSAASLGISSFSMQVDDVCHEQIRLLWHILACMCEQSAGSRTEILGSGFMNVILQYIQLESQDTLVCSLVDLHKLVLRTLLHLDFCECR